jgi:hypothetical protein
MAVKHPGSGIVGQHVNRHHASRKKFNHIGIALSIGNGFAVYFRKVRTTDLDCWFVRRHRRLESA